MNNNVDYDGSCGGEIHSRFFRQEISGKSGGENVDKYYAGQEKKDKRIKVLAIDCVESYFCQGKTQSQKQAVDDDISSFFQGKETFVNNGIFKNLFN